MATWIVQAPTRKGSRYYSVVRKAEGSTPSSSVTIGRIEGEPEPYPLTLRLRAILEVAAEHGYHELPDDIIRSIILARDDESARLTAGIMLAEATEAGRLHPRFHAPPPPPKPEPKPSPKPPKMTTLPGVPSLPTLPEGVPGGVIAGTPEALIPLCEYHERIFWPARIGERPDPDCKVIAPSSIEADRKRYERMMSGPLGDLRWIDMNAWVWKDWVNTLTVAPRTKKLYQAAYQAMLKYARRKGHILTIHDFFPVFGAAAPPPREDPLTVDEITALLTSADDPLRRLMWSVAIGQGLRPSELVRVEGEDIDMYERTMRVRPDPATGRGKTELSVGVIPLTPFTVREVERYIEAVGDDLPDGPVFTWRGERVTSYRTALQIAAAKAGITRRVHPYLLRHSFATLAFNLGLPREVTRRIGRWTDDRMLDEVYCRPRATDLAKLATAMDLDVDALSAAAAAAK